MKIFKNNSNKDSKEDDNKVIPLWGDHIDKSKVIDNTSDTKYSALLFDLIKPFHKENPRPKELLKLIDIGIAAWNSSVVKTMEPDVYEIYAKMIKENLNFPKDEFIIFNKLIDRKGKEFSEHNKFIVDSEISDKGEMDMIYLKVYTQEYVAAMNSMTSGYNDIFNDEEDDEYDDYVNSEGEPGYIDRCAIRVKPKQAFIDWLNMISANEIYEDDENNLYLAEEMDSNEDVRKWLKKNYKKIFENELSDWGIMKNSLSKPMTWKLFEEWFETETHSMVFDLESYRVRK